MKINRLLLLVLLVMPIALMFFINGGNSTDLGNQNIQNAEVNIYTSRHYDADELLYDEFTQETGIKVNIISGKGSALIERLKAEGMNSPGDVLFTVDAGNLSNFQKQGLLQP